MGNVKGHQFKNIVSERKRKRKVSKRLYALRRLVPNVSSACRTSRSPLLRPLHSSSPKRHRSSHLGDDDHHIHHRRRATFKVDKNE
ncbi:hypothetical protein DM860_013160 [Cuscuta australis]|uniref:BHLH domain-containing protein n=1 Tax=Cuscuta australis TaxID=267555 RepID=A0A328D7W3_9ASTE|nr:hypothetical protein DM860_013160 [Cuscuta australis]